MSTCRPRPYVNLTAPRKIAHVAQRRPDHREPVYSGPRRVPGLYQRRLADGTVVFDAAVRLGGRVRRYRLRARTKTDAVAELRALQTDFERGELHRSGAASVTLADLADDYLAHLRARTQDTDPRRRRAPRTVSHYESQLRLHVLPVLGDRPVGELTVADIRRLLDALAAKRLAPRSRGGVLGIVSGLLSYGVKQGICPRNPARDLDREDRPGTQRLSEPRYLTVEEVGRLLAAMGDTFRPVAATCAMAGLRVSEALGLLWREVDFEGATLTVSAQLGVDGRREPLKTPSSAATVPLLPRLASELREHRSRVASQSLARVKPDAFVFTTATGRPHNRRNVLRAVRAAADAAGLNGDGRPPVGVHDLRHSFVAIALAAGLTLPEVAAAARHANPRVTATVYAGLTDAARQGLPARLRAAFEQ